MTTGQTRKPLTELDPAALDARIQQLEARHQQLQARKLKLDLTRGKPATEQLDLSNDLDGILKGDYRLADGSDARNYGGLRGIPEARQLGAELLGTRAEVVMAGGNSSLTLMYQIVTTALNNGLWGPGSSWRASTGGKPVRFLCPAPGYDRHFAICEALGIEMIPVAIGPDGPDVAQLTELVSADPTIKGIWCVPKYANPTGCTYSDEVVRGLAALPKSAGEHFLVLWDNAYAVHHLQSPGDELSDLMAAAEAAGTADQVVMFSSTSKITFAGAGVAFLASSENVLKQFERQLGFATIGPDKVNQLRHVRFLSGRIDEHMRQHAELVKPKFDAVLAQLQSDLAGLDIASWTEPRGGYFISFDCRPGLAREIVRLAGEAGVTLTPAGATWPYGKDPQDSNIRLAPTFPSLSDVEAATEVFTLCVELASARQLRAG